MNIEEIKDRVNLTKNAFHKLGIEGQVNINVMLNDIEFLLKEIERTNEILIWKQKHEEQLQKEIEELKASHITTNNKATNTENSIDTYIEKLKPYWEQIMGKDEMTIDEALTIIDDMYQDRYKIMSQKTEKETIVDLGKMDYIKFTNLEWASVRALREVQSLNYELEELKDKIKAKIEELEKQDRESRISHNYLVIPVLQSLLEEKEL